MPISRIDIMTMAPKSNEVTGYKVNQNQKPVHEQVMLNENQQKTIQHNHQQTVRKSETDNPEYRYDAKEKGNNQYQGKQKKNSKNKEEVEKEEKEKNNKYGYIGERHIDVSI